MQRTTQKSTERVSLTIQNEKGQRYHGEDAPKLLIVQRLRDYDEEKRK